MKRTWGTLLATAFATAVVAWLAPFPASAAASTSACGSGSHGAAGYAYAGFESTHVSSGVRATVTVLRAPSVKAGHAAAWIGVGGTKAGANGETMWLQVGVAALPNTPAMVYAEITRPGLDPVFLPLTQNVQVGESHRLAVLEMNERPGAWRVWLDGKPATDPVVLPGSHRIWKPIVTAESWNGGVATCNRFGFRFERVGIAASLGGSWRTFEPGYRFEDRGYVIRQLRPDPGGQRTLSADNIEAYAFDASSAGSAPAAG
ncbi:MAG TPA: hypothetical protein VHH57_06185 [Gaiella sp.]|nr:hypothetical protein [Gaiella sp.]